MLYNRFFLGFLFCCYLSSFWACQAGQTDRNFSESSLKQGNPHDSSLPQELNVYPGDYTEIKIGVKGNHISGVFFDESKANRCILLFEGILGTDNPIPIIAHNPSSKSATIKGTFLLSGQAMIVQLNKTLSKSCNQEFVDGVGLAAVLTDQADWSAIRMLAHSTALYEDFGGGIATDTQLSEGTVLAVLEKRKSWYRVQVQNEQKDLGWIQEYSLYPLLIHQ